MDIFISWSGERSKALAEALRSWLPKVIQNLNPWISVSDIEKGARWLIDISEKLENQILAFSALLLRIFMNHGYCLKPVLYQRLWTVHLSAQFSMDLSQQLLLAQWPNGPISSN